MNFFEDEIRKYERRVAHIEAKPSPNMLRANQLLYQAQLEGNRELLKAWKEGKHFVATNGAGTVLMQCFGDFRMLNLVRMADRLGTDRAEAAFAKVRAMGLPDYPCDRTILFLPLASMGEDMPKPSVIVDRTTGCEVSYHTKIALANYTGVPLFSIDVPFEDPYQQHLGYVTAQFEQLVKWVEVNLPGAKYDESKLVWWQDQLKRWYGALHDIYELRKTVPCPDHPRDVFREPVYPGQYTDPELFLEYYEMYRDELKERIKKGYSPVGEEKLRIVWAITGPFGSGIWDYLAKRGVSVPYWHYGGADRVYTKPAYGDLTDFGRKLTPLEEEARIALYNSWAGCGERWVSDTVNACKEFKADGLVQFEQTGCLPVLGMGELVAKRLEKEQGIPSWRVEGRQLLSRTPRVDEEFMAGLEAFVNLCFDRKKARV